MKDWGRIARGKRRLAGAVLLVGGLLLAWRSWLAEGSGCGGKLVPPATSSSCAPTSYDLWWRWPGMALGGLLALVALLILIHAAREGRASR